MSEITGMYELLDALEEALKSADLAKRRKLAQTMRAYEADLPDSVGAQSPALLHNFDELDRSHLPPNIAIEGARLHSPCGAKTRGERMTTAPQALAPRFALIAKASIAHEKTESKSFPPRSSGPSARALCRAQPSS